LKRRNQFDPSAAEFNLDGNRPSPNVSAVNLDENRFTSSAEPHKPGSTRRGKSTTTWFALYGFLFISIALFAYMTNVLLGPLRLLLLYPPLFRQINEAIVWYSGIPLVIGVALIGWDLIRNVTRSHAAGIADALRNLRGLERFSP
jgi:hypothetical protein